MTNTIFTSYKDELFLSATLVVVLLTLATVATAMLSRNQPMEIKRFWRLTFRHVAAIAVVVGLMFIWRKELHAVIVALGAATAAIFLAFRESLQSMAAFWMRVGRRHYGLDDFIEVDGIRGRVLDITWLTTVLAETGPGKDGLAYSGRVVHVPNSRIMLRPLFVDNLTGEYSAHLIHVHLPDGANPLKAEKVLQDAANRACAPYVVEAANHMRGLQRAQALDTPSVEPKIQLRIEEEGMVTLVLRIVVPFTEKMRLEQTILHEFLYMADNEAWPRSQGGR